MMMMMTCIGDSASVLHMEHGGGGAYECERGRSMTASHVENPPHSTDFPIAARESRARSSPDDDVEWMNAWAMWAE
jgi:hypothetical protein